MENVEPFLFNLFNDPAILNLPGIFRFPLAKLIANRRAPIAKKIYKELGGSSPILKLTIEQSEKLEKKLNGLPVQGGLDPKILLTNKEKIKKNTENYLNIFKDYPYIFNLGHGGLPEIKPETIEYIIQLVRNKK